MFLKRKINRTLMENRQQIKSEENKTPLEITKDLVNFFEWKVFFSANSYGSAVKKNDLENTIIIKTSLSKSESVFPFVKQNCLPNLKLTGIYDEMFNTKFVLEWTMNLDDYENIYDYFNGIRDLSDYLSSDFSKAYKKIYNNQTDEAYQLLLIQHAPSFEHIIQSLKKSILETSSVSKELAGLHIEILSNFVAAVNERYKILSTEKNKVSSSFSKNLEDEMKKEIMFQRKMLGLPIS